tara:strand:- start:1485 stop:3665 length:2181 start_codon:yes stop_codon:yes gene_type:complete
MGLNFGDKPTTTTGTSIGQYPEWMKKDMLEAQDAYKRLYESNLGRGYRPYTGMTTAGFTPEQIASQQGLASLVGSQAPIQQEALGLTRGVTSEFTPDQAQKYMSPYLRASLDAQKAAAQRQFEGTKLPQLEAEAVAAGGMSGLGSRAGVQFAEAQAAQNRLMADLEATGQQKAYEDAQNLFKSQKERERQTALALENLNRQIFTGGIKEQALLDAIGKEKQQMAQTLLDEAQTKYYDKEEFARNELNKWYQSLLGNPIWKQPNYATTGTQAGGGPGMGKTLMSLAGIGLGLGGFKVPFMKGGGSIGGGLASMAQARPYMNYMRRNMGGQVMPPVVYRQTGGGELLDEDAAFQTGENRPISDIYAAREAVEEAGINRLAPPNVASSVGEGPDILRRADDPSAVDRVRGWTITNLKNLAEIEEGRVLATGNATKEEIKGIRKETKAFQQKQTNRFNKYQSMVKNLVGEDPNANRKFWFTVAAAIGKPGGNAFTNMAEGFKQATLNADADRKEKNKMLMTLAKDEMDFMKDVDTLGFKSELKLLGLTKAQQVEVANMDSNIRKRFIEEYKIHGDYLKAKAAVNKGKGDKAFGSQLEKAQREIAKEYGFVIDQFGNLGAGRGSPPLKSPLYQNMIDRLQTFRRLYLDKLDELGSTSYKAQLEATRYAFSKTPKYNDKFKGTGDVDPKYIFANIGDAKREVEKNKGDYLGRTIQIGDTKFKVTASGYQRVR